MSKKKKLFQVLMLSLVFAGCSSNGGLITSFEDLTTESRKEGVFKLPQYRVISVPGILPFADAGSLQFYMPRRKPSTSIGLSDSDSSSYVLESVIECECDKETFLNIRNKLVLLRAKAEAYVESKIDYTKKYSLLHSGKIEESRKEDFKSLVANAKTELGEVKSTLDSLYQDVVGSIDKNGILIYRWSYNSSKEGSLNFGNVTGRKNEKYNGFALLSGLRTATLFVGKDLIDEWEHLNMQSKYANRFELTTYVMQAKYISYVTEYDLLGMIEAKLKASDLSKKMKKLNMIEIEAALSKVANLSNMGFLGNTERKRKLVDWSNPLQNNELDSLKGWQTFYSVASDLTDLMELLSKKKN